MGMDETEVASASDETETVVASASVASASVASDETEVASASVASTDTEVAVSLQSVVPDLLLLRFGVAAGFPHYVE